METSLLSTQTTLSFRIAVLLQNTTIMTLAKNRKTTTMVKSVMARLLGGEPLVTTLETMDMVTPLAAVEVMPISITVPNGVATVRTV